MKNLSHILFYAFLMVVCNNYQIKAQVTNIPNNGFAGAYVGWDGTMTIPLDIRNESAQPINFYTFSLAGTTNNWRMTILGNTDAVGIGNNLLTYTPSFFLDVQNQINVNFSGTSPITTLGIGYGIAGNTVLQIPGLLNTFSGVNAGANWVSGQSNTFMGENAGSNNDFGSFNTFMGSNAGVANTSARYNTYVGNLSGTNNSGASNSFFGHHSGFNCIGGDFNTFLGEHAGFGSASNAPFGSYNTFVGHNAGADYFTARDNSIVGAFAGQTLFRGEENAFFGNLAGRFNSDGSHNTFIGFRAGQNNINGNFNTLIGYLSFAQAIPAINNATAIGSQAQVMQSNTMILCNTPHYLDQRGGLLS